jgi:hypothetical protein
METLKPIRTNSKVIIQAIQKNIIEALNTEEYEKQDNTTKTSLEIVVDAFKGEYWHDYNKKYYKYNRQNAFKSWLCGAPSCIDISLWNEDIINYLDSIGLPQPTNKDDQDSVNLYFSLFYREFLKLCKKNEINF